MSKFVTIPASWYIFELPDDIFALLGSRISEPPHIVIESLVAQGVAKKVATINAPIVVHSNDSDDDTDEDGPKPWFTKGEE